MVEAETSAGKFEIFNLEIKTNFGESIYDNLRLLGQTINTNQILRKYVEIILLHLQFCVRCHSFVG